MVSRVTSGHFPRFGIIDQGRFLIKEASQEPTIFNEAIVENIGHTGPAEEDEIGQSQGHEVGRQEQAEQPAVNGGRKSTLLEENKKRTNRVYLDDTKQCSHSATTVRKKVKREQQMPSD